MTSALKPEKTSASQRALTARSSVRSTSAVSVALLLAPQGIPKTNVPWRNGFCEFVAALGFGLELAALARALGAALGELAVLARGLGAALGRELASVRTDVRRHGVVTAQRVAGATARGRREARPGVCGRRLGQRGIHHEGARPRCAVGTGFWVQPKRRRRGANAVPAIGSRETKVTAENRLERNFWAALAPSSRQPRALSRTIS